MSTQQKNWLHWTPRVLAIVYILFLGLFALDVISPEYSLGEILLGLFMHLIPNFILIAVLVIAWRWALLGGALFLIFGIWGVFRYSTYERLDVFLFISLPYFVTGFLFILDDWINRHQGQSQTRAG